MKFMKQLKKATAYYHLPGLFEFYELYKEFLPCLLYTSHRKANIKYPKRKAINTRGVWQIISCDTANGFKLGK